MFRAHDTIFSHFIRIVKSTTGANPLLSLLVFWKRKTTITRGFTLQFVAATPEYSTHYIGMVRDKAAEEKGDEGDWVRFCRWIFGVLGDISTQMSGKSFYYRRLF